MKGTWVIVAVDGSTYFYRGAEGWLASDSAVGVSFTHIEKNLRVFHPWATVRAATEEGRQ